MNEARSRLIRCFAAVFPELSEQEIPFASSASVGSWDSVASVTLMSVLEEEFGTEFQPDDLEYLISFELILDHLQTAKNVS